MRASNGTRRCRSIAEVPSSTPVRDVIADAEYRCAMAFARWANNSLKCRLTPS
jgi:hypothetical protein